MDGDIPYNFPISVDLSNRLRSELVSDRSLHQISPGQADHKRNFQLSGFQA